MSKDELQPREDRLIDKYHKIGPAVLVAALNATQRDTEGRNDNRRDSILSVRKAR